MAATYQIDTGDQAKNQARHLYWGPMPLPFHAEIVGIISGSGGNGALIRFANTGAYARGREGAISSVDRSKVRAILGDSPEAVEPASIAPVAAAIVGAKLFAAVRDPGDPLDRPRLLAIPLDQVARVSGR